jgi:glycerophosphoryl diester phosphodiesterase
MGKKARMENVKYLFSLENISEINAVGRAFISQAEKLHKNSIYAHRGLWGKNCPENSMHALCRAVLAGYSIELDVRMTKDGVVVVSHDSDMRRSFGVEGKIEGKTYAELYMLDFFAPKNKIVRLDDFLLFFKNNADYRCELAIHIKEFSMKLVEELAKQLLKYTLASKAFIFDIRLEDAKNVKEKYPFIRCGASIVDDKAKSKSEKYYGAYDLPYLSIFDVFWIDEWENLYSETFLRNIASYNKKVVAVSPELHYADGNRKEVKGIWGKLIRNGCREICTDYPNELHAFMVSGNDKGNTV